MWTPQPTGAPATDTVEATLQTLRGLCSDALRGLAPYPEPPQHFVEPLADALIALYLLDSAHARAQQTQQPAHRAMVALYHETGAPSTGGLVGRFRRRLWDARR
jgi:hypothetical protein